MKNILVYIALLMSGLIALPVSAAETSMAISKTALTRSNARVDIVQKVLPDSLSKFGSRIVGGTTAPRGKYPEFTQLWVDGLDGFIYAICGATLIADNKVLTAAHCVNDFSTSLLFVVPNFYSFNDSLTFEDLIPLSGKVVHPAYNPNTSNNDVAVLTAQENSSTPKAKLILGPEQFVGAIATVVGNGDTHEGSGQGAVTLREVSLPIVSNAVCASAYSGVLGITSKMLCAGLASGGKDSCQGDSSGPLWVDYKGQRAQAGIVSFGEGCARPNRYGVYSRVSELISFVKQHAPVATVSTEDAISISPVLYLLLND